MIIPRLSDTHESTPFLHLRLHSSYPLRYLDALDVRLRGMTFLIKLYDDDKKVLKIYFQPHKVVEKVSSENGTSGEESRVDS
jgi:hypothetical protein